MNKLYISSPAGSGNTYMKHFLSENANINAIVYSHDAKDIVDIQKHLLILRNPYDSIGSGAARHKKQTKILFLI